MRASNCETALMNIPKDAKDGQLEDFYHLPASKMSQGKNATSHHQFITVPDSEMGRAPPQRNM